MRRRSFLEGSVAGAALVGCAPAQRRPEPAASLQLRPADERGRADLGWLQARHSFSFSRYRDPAFMNFRGLRVLNEDRIAPSGGFPTHPHRDMEIVTYLLQGALEHRDTLGNGGVIRPGEVQRMSAGHGIRHSEFSAAAVTTHLLQIWIEPARRGDAPSYEDRRLVEADLEGALVPLAAPPDRASAVTIHADATILAGRLHRQGAEHLVRPGRAAWIQVARGSLRANELVLSAGDGAFTTSPGRIRFRETDDAEILVFDLS